MIKFASGGGKGKFKKFGLMTNLVPGRSGLGFQILALFYEQN
jgi:hypothetical protein